MKLITTRLVGYLILNLYLNDPEIVYEVIRKLQNNKNASLYGAEIAYLIEKLEKLKI